MQFDKSKRDVHNIFQVSIDTLKQYDEETLYIKSLSHKKPILIRFVKTIKYQGNEHEALHIHDVCDVLMDRGCCFNNIKITYRLCEDVCIDKYRVIETDKYNLVLLRVKYMT